MSVSKTRPILFSAPMVQAILAGHKTQTRRIVKPQPQWDPNWGTHAGMNGAWIYGADEAKTRDRWSVVLDDNHRLRMCTEEAYGWGVGSGCPYGVAGSKLWVRETWQHVARHEGQPEETVYRADGEDFSEWSTENDEPFTWRPSIFMRPADSRITLDVTGVRVERLQDISEADAKAEGIVDCGNGAFDGGGSAMGTSAVVAYMRLWDSINGKRAPWASNPWVWVVEFARRPA